MIICKKCKGLGSWRASNVCDRCSAPEFKEPVWNVHIFPRVLTPEEIDEMWQRISRHVDHPVFTPRTSC
jgi:hypothetical protein